MGAPKIPLPRVRVILPDQDELVLQILNPDLLRWDVTAAKHRWPGFRENPNRWLTFIGWAAAVRTGAYAGSYDQFASEAMYVGNLKEDEDLEETGDLEGVGPGIGDPSLEGLGPD